MFSRALKIPTPVFTFVIAHKEGEYCYCYFTDGTKAQRLNYIPAARQKRGGTGK